VKNFTVVFTNRLLATGGGGPCGATRASNWHFIQLDFPAAHAPAAAPRAARPASWRTAPPAARSLRRGPRRRRCSCTRSAPRPRRRRSVRGGSVRVRVCVCAVCCARVCACLHIWALGGWFNRGPAVSLVSGALLPGRCMSLACMRVHHAEQRGSREGGFLEIASASDEACGAAASRGMGPAGGLSGHDESSLGLTISDDIRATTPRGRPDSRHSSMPSSLDIA
jgi:hypothetical protein